MGREKEIEIKMALRDCDLFAVLAVALGSSVFTLAAVGPYISMVGK